MVLSIEFINEHSEIRKLLEQCKKGRGFQSKEWREDLFRAKKLFEEHLSKENELLYPLLEKGAGAESSKIFENEMRNISKDVLDFFKKYEESLDGPDFSADFSMIVTLLEKRMRAEEKELYPLIGN